MWWYLLGIDTGATDVEHGFGSAAEHSSWRCCSVRALFGVSGEGTIDPGAALLCYSLLSSPGHASAPAVLSLMGTDTHHTAGLGFGMLHAVETAVCFLARLLIGIVFCFEVLVPRCRGIEAKCYKCSLAITSLWWLSD